MVRKLTIKESQDVEIEVQNKGVLEVPEGKSVDELPIKHFVAIADKKGLDTVIRALNNLQVWNKNKNKTLSKWAGDMIDKVSKRFENRKDESYHAKHIHEIYSRNFINSCIADMEAKGLSYDGTNNRGYLIFKDNETNKSHLFSDWDDVNNYDEDSLSDFDMAESIDFDDITIPEDERYEYIKSKSVLDSDGFQTDYTMYYDWEDDKYVFIFGDSDIYTPANEYPDYECESEREANEWFADYEGFIDESYEKKIKEDIDDISELSAKELAKLIKDTITKIKFKPVDLEQSVFNEDGTDTYYLVIDKVYKAFNSNFYAETNYPIEISKTPIIFRKNNRGTISMIFINAGRIWKITKNGKVTIEAINPYSKRDTLIYIYEQLKELESNSLGESLKEESDIERLSLQDFYRWFDINYGGDLEDFRDYKLALTKAKVVRLKNNKYIFNTDEALMYDRNGQLK